VDLLRVQNLSKRFGRYEALSSISFGLEEQEVVGVIGPNGAGKTTLLECLVGLMPTSGGTLVWSEQASRRYQDRRDLMFYLPDELTAYADLFAGDVLGLFGDIYQVDLPRFDEILDKLELAPYLGQRTGTLSRGTRRRLQLALALMTPQPLLILDEPFNALDLHQVQMAMSLLRDVRAAGRTLLLAVHQLTDAERICDRFLLLAAGRLAGAGSLHELRAQAGLPTGSLEDVLLALA
jgi:ABC-2 type transport system ATP-binding protein